MRDTLGLGKAASRVVCEAQVTASGLDSSAALVIIHMLGL